MTDVVAPEGMKHVGYYCDHSDHSTVHMTPKWSGKKQAYKLKESPTVISAHSDKPHRDDRPVCPHALPTFVVVSA